MAAQQGSQWHLNHLLKWLHLYNVNVQAPPPDAANLSDGVVVAMVLSMIDPPWFHEDWLSKIKRNVGSNKILKVSNLKKVLERLVDYYEVHLDQRLSGFSIPDVNKIGEGSDENELCRLLQLVLGCAVHCERQEEFIQAILQMEEEVQQGIMTAIQELPGIQELAGGSLVPNSDSLAAMAGRSPNQTTGGLGFQNLLSQLEAANEERKLLAKERQKLNLQISHLQDEINHLQTEVESLRSGGTLESMDKDASKTEMLIQKREILRLTEELMKSDTAKEEFRIRCESFEQELSRMRLRQEDLQNAADENRSLKDEVDILRERSGRLTTAESTIDSMRKKVEEGNELKRQLRKLDEKNAQYVHQNMELEEELKKLGPWKSQLELQKKQISELQLKLDEERKTADKFELQFKNLQEKNETLNQEKERLMGERNKLTEANEELRFAQLNHGTTSTMIDGSPTTTGGVDTLDMIPPEIREKLLRLEHENRRLRKQQDGQQHSGPSNQEVLETVLGGLQERIDQLEAENRKSNQRVSELEIQLEDQRVASPVSNDSHESRHNVSSLKIRIKSLEREAFQKKMDMDKLESKLVEQRDLLHRTKESLRQKENDMHGMEERYKKHIEKAKHVLQSLNTHHSSTPEVAALIGQLKEKDKLIERLERETEHHKALRETEDHLVTTAFYNLVYRLLLLFDGCTVH